jgi:hypothetical protein
MSEIVVVGSFTGDHVQAVLARAPELFGESGDIVVYEAASGGETKKGSLADHAAG